MAQSARASDRWCWHIYLMMWCYFLCHFFFSLQILRRADKNGKYCQRAASTHSQTQPQALSRVQKQMHFFNEILIRTVSFFFVCFHGNRKMAMPIEVRFHDINEVKHRKLAAVRHFCPVASHLKVWVAKVQRKTCCYLSCMVHIRIMCSTSLQNTALNWSHRSVLIFDSSSRCNFHFQPQTQNNLSDILRILFSVFLHLCLESASLNNIFSTNCCVVVLLKWQSPSIRHFDIVVEVKWQKSQSSSPVNPSLLQAFLYSQIYYLSTLN